MEVAITELAKHVTKLVERAEHGEDITITRHGKAVARLTRTDGMRKQPKLGTMKGIVRLQPGWDEPLPLADWEMLEYAETPEQPERKTTKRAAPRRFAR